MNFREQYKSTFSEIHASEELKEKLMEAKKMEGNKIKITKNKKKITAILIAAALAATSAVAVSAGELGDVFHNLRLFINGKEVSASDYVDVSGDSIKLTPHGDDEYVIDVDNSSEMYRLIEALDVKDVENCDSGWVTAKGKIPDEDAQVSASRGGGDKNTFVAIDAKLEDLKLYFDGRQVNAGDYIHSTNEVVKSEYGDANVFEMDPVPKDVVESCVINTKDGSVSIESYRTVENYDDSWIDDIIAEFAK